MLTNGHFFGYPHCCITNAQKRIQALCEENYRPEDSRPSEVQRNAGGGTGFVPCQEHADLLSKIREGKDRVLAVREILQGRVFPLPFPLDEGTLGIVVITPDWPVPECFALHESERQTLRRYSILIRGESTLEDLFPGSPPLEEFVQLSALLYCEPHLPPKYPRREEYLERRRRTLAAIKHYRHCGA